MTDVRKNSRRSRWRAVGAPSVLALLLLTLLLSLAAWQFGRWQQRSAADADFDTAATRRVMVAGEVPAPRRYDRVTATGRYDGERQFLIDNMVANGRNGFFVITPMKLATGGPLLLVNRGWVVQDPARRVLPEIGIADGVRTIGGRAGRLPVAGLRLGASPPVDTGWPSVRQFPDTAELEAALGAPVRDWVLLLDGDEPEGFLRDWRAPGLPAERHLGYAVQWFALAIALIVLWWLWIRRQTKETRR